MTKSHALGIRIRCIMLILEKLRRETQLLFDPSFNMVLVMGVQYHLSFYIRYIERHHPHLEKGTYNTLRYNSYYIFWLVLAYCCNWDKASMKSKLLP